MTYNEGATGARERVATVEGEVAIEQAERSHASVRGLLSEYLDDALEHDRRERVRRHLERCQSCRALLRTLEATVALAGQLPSSRLPDEAKRRILERVVTGVEHSAPGG